MDNHRKPLTILMADDDEDDRMMTREAMDEAELGIDMRFVEDGEELMDYLRRQGKYTQPDTAPQPDLILLDLNMPKKDGREALKDIKEDPILRHIPVVVLTTSKADEDVQQTYDLGVNSFITKSVSFGGMVAVIKALSQYWFDTTRLPCKPTGT